MVWAEADWGEKATGSMQLQGPLPPLPIPSPLAWSGLQIQLGALGERCKLPQQDSGQSRSRKCIFGHILSLGNASGDNSCGSYFTSHYPINFLNPGPIGKSRGFPVGQSGPGLSYCTTQNASLNLLTHGNSSRVSEWNVPLWMYMDYYFH